ncbi:MAG: FtsQ-type POTRA domain-containing protein [Deltaproteobacteria bacterium]|nr:FtsQ-type POTRA domain-containing protein [Deltaproteobacteria bacterium]MBW1967113.1 FtsQ-type POTRA domain-containing protein [Deltaproteobacteria bacterium]MBW2097598.1 FtsQ-type POTRA domain-containing protein [Deltaproteobacteria bacterium]
MKIRRTSTEFRSSMHGSGPWTSLIFPVSWSIHPKMLIAMASACLVLAGLFVCWHWVCRSELFRVGQVLVKGCNHLTEEEVLQISGVTARDNLMSLDLESIATNIEAHPWVNAVEVERDLPDHLMITIKERTPVALLNSDKIYLIDEQGKIIDELLSAEEPVSLPIITGIDPKYTENHQITESPDHQIQKALELISMAGRGTRTLGVNNISQIHIAGKDTLILYTADSGIPFHFDTEDLSSQFSEAEKVLYQLYSSGKYKKVAKVELDYGPGQALVSLKD